MKKVPELLSPAGNFEKMVAAVRYGADAVYLAGKAFGMRSAADNFTLEELSRAVRYAHERGVKVYLTVNTMPHEDEYPALEQYLTDLRAIPVDALIVGDIGVVRLVRKLLPDAAIHISTQASAVSSRDCLAWRDLGASRVVMARELTLEEIRRIRAAIPPELEIECFIHGSMCVSYSGRCLLSEHIVGRDGNRGMCAQPCRWNYTIRGYEITEEKRPELPMPIEEVNGETFIMSSRDTCLIEHIPALVEAGIDSFKIEGRMKSAYYTAAVTNAYRMALDSYASGDYRYDPRWMDELTSVTHRAYATGFYFGDPRGEANTVTEIGYIKEKAYLAIVLSYNPLTGIALLEQRNKMCVGDAVELLSPGRVGEPMTVDALYDEDGAPIEDTRHPCMKFGMRMPRPVAEGDMLRAR